MDVPLPFRDLRVSFLIDSPETFWVSEKESSEDSISPGPRTPQRIGAPLTQRQDLTISGYCCRTAPERHWGE